MKKLKIIFKAPTLTQSGYGQHSRQIVRWLESHSEIFDVKYAITPWGQTSWILDPKLENGLIGKIIEKSTVLPNEKFDVALMNVLPNEWQTLGRYNIGMSAFTESNEYNPEWIHCINQMNLVIVPSTFVLDVITFTAQKNNISLKTDIKVIPEAFPEEVFSNDLPDISEKLDLTTDFNFLIFGQMTSNKEEADRKNLFRTIKWIFETFRKDPDVGIVLKTNCSRNTTYDRRFTTDILRNYINSFRKNSEEGPKIYLLHGSLDNKETISLYKNPKIKALVSLHRGESWGLTLQEAAACDLPVIATNWSGSLDFLNLGKFIKIDYDLVDVPKTRVDEKIFIKGSKWAEPRELSVKKSLKKFREGSDIPKEWAIELGLKVREKYSQEQINKEYDKIIEDYINKWFI